MGGCVLRMQILICGLLTMAPSHLIPIPITSEHPVFRQLPVVSYPLIWVSYSFAFEMISLPGFNS